MRADRSIGGLALFAILLTAAGAGVAIASSSGDGRIHACVGRGVGFVRIVAPGTGCQRNEAPITWNIQGPPGPPGPSHLSVMLRERTQTFTIDPGAPEGKGVAAACLNDEVVVGGGLTGRSAGTELLSLVSVGPFFDGNRSGWGMEWVNTTDEPVTVQVTVAAECVPGDMTTLPG